ncbi:hypothetical protein GCM10029964_038510 [Kibdelosporangium lantanae]
MDSYTGPARLEWQANSSTCLGSFDVDLSVVVDDAGWHASATFLTPPQGEDWALLMRLDPYFTLRFLETSRPRSWCASRRKRRMGAFS